MGGWGGERRGWRRMWDRGGERRGIDDGLEAGGGGAVAFGVGSISGGGRVALAWDADFTEDCGVQFGPWRRGGHGLMTVCVNRVEYILLVRCICVYHQ